MNVIPILVSMEGIALIRQTDLHVAAQQAIQVISVRLHRLGCASLTHVEPMLEMANALTCHYPMK